MNCKLPPRSLTPEEESRRQKAAIRQNDKRLHYADRLFCLSLHENAGFGQSRILDVLHSGYEIGQAYIEKHAQEGETDLEYAVNSYYALARDLRDWGWNPGIELWRDDVFSTFPHDKNTASVRQKWADRLEYSRGISFYVREMLCMGALYLREELGWAAVRLGRVYNPVRDGYLALMREYMRCSDEGDRRMEAMVKDVRTRYNAMGYFAEEYN